MSEEISEADRIEQETAAVPEDVEDAAEQSWQDAVSELDESTLLRASESDVVEQHVDVPMDAEGYEDDESED